MKTVKLSKSTIGELEKNAVLSVLENEYLGMGEEVRKFENELSQFFGREAICVATGTAALQLAIECSDIGEGDEVLVPSLTYVASFQAITATGATPVACDVESTHLSIDLKDAEQRLTKKTKAIMVVHYGGAVGDFESILEFANKYSLRVIEDAAHAFGTKYKGKRIGSIGDITCFSFDGIKNITSGEGGCVVSNDIELNSRIKDARLLGVEKDTEARFSGQRSWDFEVLRQGWRYHMSNIMAAIGRAQLTRFDELSGKRQLIARRYVELLKCQDKVRPIISDFSNVIPHIFVVQLPTNTDRDVIRKELRTKGIETGVHYKPNHTLRFFSQNGQLPFLTLDKIFPTLLTLPLHPDLNVDDIDYVVASLISSLS